MFIRVIVRAVAFLLIAEAMFGALRLSVLLSQLGIYDALAIVLILARGALGVLQFTGGWLVANHRPPGVVFARWALVAGAVLTIFDVGLQLAPTRYVSNLPKRSLSSWRTPAVIIAAASLALSSA